MIADGFTKTLITIKHKVFIEMTSLEDQSKLLAAEI